MLTKIKDHVVKHKELYLIAVFAGITCYIMRGRIAILQSGMGGPSRVPESLALRGDLVIRPLAFLSKQTNYIFVTIKQELGRPPYLIHDITDDLWYKSQSAAAKALNVSDSTMSQHLTGKAAHAAGHQLERILIEA